MNHERMKAKEEKMRQQRKKAYGFCMASEEYKALIHEKS